MVQLQSHSTLTHHAGLSPVTAALFGRAQAQGGSLAIRFPSAPSSSPLDRSLGPSAYIAKLRGEARRRALPRSMVAMAAPAAPMVPSGGPCRSCRSAAPRPPSSPPPPPVASQATRAIDPVHLDAAAAAASAITAFSPSEQKSLSDVLSNAGKKALGGGIPGMAAMGVQVLSLMWLRTTINYQYRYGTTTSVALKTLYKEGGVVRWGHRWLGRCRLPLPGRCSCRAKPAALHGLAGGEEQHPLAAGQKDAALLAPRRRSPAPRCSA
jgi:hypothetical protein